MSNLPDVVLDASMAVSTFCQDFSRVNVKEEEAMEEVMEVVCGRDGMSSDSGMMLSQGFEQNNTGPYTPSPYSSRSTSSHSRGCTSRCSMISIDSCDSDCREDIDEGEAMWDMLGRMSSIRRSSRFDKPQLMTVSVQRGSGGFGLELKGKAPPVVASVSGETALLGVKVGDRLIEVNGRTVRGLSHEEAGKVILEGPEQATLLLHTLKPPPTPRGQVIYSGWLSKRGGSGMTPRNWRKRWFVVRDDCIAYYYSGPTDARPLGAIVLRNYTVSKACHGVKKPFAFRIVKGGARSYYFSADTEVEMNKWAQVFTEGATLEGRESVHFSAAGTAHNVSLSALSIKDPDCHGWLYKQGHSIRTWKRRYCVLKAHQLFYYGKMTHTTAYGVMNLQGYRIVCGKTKEKKYYFQALPPRKELKDYKFYTESEVERERWMESLRLCVGKAK